jgi:hypothetical protein
MKGKIKREVGKGTPHPATNPRNLFMKGKKRKQTDKQSTAEDRQHQYRDLDNKKKRKVGSASSIGKTPRSSATQKMGGSRGGAMCKKKTVRQQTIVTKKKAIKTTGKFGGKSNALGQGGRAAQLRAQGVPGGVIGNLARAAGAAPGQPNYHKKGKKK